jgi:hypothetical protein
MHESARCTGGCVSRKFAFAPARMTARTEVISLAIFSCRFNPFNGSTVHVTEG